MPPPPQRDISKGFGTAAAAGTGFKQYLQKDEPIMAFPHPAYAEPVSSPVTGHVEETMHLLRAPQKAMPVPPASYERSMNQSQTESRLSAIRKLSLQSVFSFTDLNWLFSILSTKPKRHNLYPPLPALIPPIRVRG